MSSATDIGRYAAPDARSIPTHRRRRNPLITPEGYATYLRLKQHAHAPKWNFDTGDRITAEDLEAVGRFQAELNAQRKGMSLDSPPPLVLARLLALRPLVPAFGQCIPEGLDLPQEWAAIAPTHRETLAGRIESMVPANADLDRLIVYDTSGTTGHALVVPHHPAAVGKTMALVAWVLDRYGVATEFGPHMTACINVGAQVQTVVFPHVASVWNQAGFVKLNLHPGGWRDPEDARRYIADLSPLFLTGDPVGFATLLEWGIQAAPRLLLSTAVAMTAALRSRLQAHFQCPVVDWYSVTEAGPIGYTCLENNGFHVLPHDIFVEILDDEGGLRPPGEVGEIVVSGGRNPYLPLLRYRTGDRAAIDPAPCPCGDPMPRLIDFMGRAAVRFMAADGSVVNPVDIGRVLRDHPILQHEFVQRSDGSCDLRLRPVLADRAPDPDRIRRRLMALFGPDATIRVHIDPELGGSAPGNKVVAYRSEVPADGSD
jgi:phenylacetate-CoA ligase